MNLSIAIVGYSGHSYVCLDIAKKNKFIIEGYYDLKQKDVNPYNLVYLGREDKYVNCRTSYFVAIGDNQIRKKISETIFNQNHNLVNLIHSSSIISPTTVMLNHNLISAGIIINAQVTIGRGTIINTGAIIEHECVIENYVHIAPGAVLLGDVKVGECSFIGANSVIKEGVKIGKNCIVGAGAVVLKDIEDNTTVVGNPARLLL